MITLDEIKEKTPVAIIKITTSYYYTGGKLRMQKEARTMRSLSSGFDHFTEEFCNQDAECFGVEINLMTADDGLYKVCCNGIPDEYGMIDDVEFYLTPYTKY